MDTGATYQRSAENQDNLSDKVNRFIMMGLEGFKKLSSQEQYDFFSQLPSPGLVIGELRHTIDFRLDSSFLDQKIEQAVGSVSYEEIKNIEGEKAKLKSRAFQAQARLHQAQNYRELYSKALAYLSQSNDLIFRKLAEKSKKNLEVVKLK